VVSCRQFRSSDEKSQATDRLIYRHSEGRVVDNAQTMQTPGQRIRNARELAGFNQGEFAKAVGCSQSTLSEIEKGDTKLPSARVLQKMTEVLGKSARWIVYGDEGELLIPTPDEQEILTAFRQLTPDTQQHLAQTIKSLAPKKQ
jgi:transcriptional regulator with XRE-family HTH domain